MSHEMRVFGTFVKRGNYIFRTEAKIQWGRGNDPIGLLIMLNPGSCRLADHEKWDMLIRAKQDSITVSGEVVLDDTMKAVHQILKQSHPNLEGILTIHNLFNLRNAVSENALDTYKGFFDTDRRELLYSNLTKCVRKEYADVLHANLERAYFEQFPWIWLAWSVFDGKILNARRKQVLKSIPQSKHKFAIYSRQKSHQHKKELFTYHVCPQNPRDRKLYEEQMIRQMNAYWNEYVLP